MTYTIVVVASGIVATILYNPAAAAVRIAQHGVERYRMHRQLEERTLIALERIDLISGATREAMAHEASTHQLRNG